MFDARAYAAAYRVRNREKLLAYLRARYHANPESYRAARLRANKKYLLKEGVCERRAAVCREWEKRNKEWRNAYKRGLRRKGAAFGLRGDIAAARRSGDLAYLVQRLKSAVTQSY